MKRDHKMPTNIRNREKFEEGIVSIDGVSSASMYPYS